MKRRKHITAILVIAVMILLQCGRLSLSAAQIHTTEEIGNLLLQSANYEYASVTNPVCASIGGEWTVFALARSGAMTDSYKTIYLTNLKAKLKDGGQTLSTQKYTDYSRVILALTSLDEAVTDFEGINLLTFLADYDKINAQGMNGAVFALLALDSGAYEIPDLKGEGTQNSREKMITRILESQLSDGGFSMSQTSADADMTAMVIQALAPYYDSDERVKASIDRALSALSSMQQENGGFQSGQICNLESTAQVLTALSVLKIPVTDKRFIKNDTTVLDAMLSFRLADGSFAHAAGQNANPMSTDQGFYALTAYYRMLTQNTSLYDMSDVLTVKNSNSQDSDTENEDSSKDSQNNLKIEEAKQLNQDIWDQIDPLRISQKDAKTVKKLMQRYQALTEEEQEYVTYAKDLIQADQIIDSLEKGIISKTIFENMQKIQESFSYSGKYLDQLTYQLEFQPEDIMVCKKMKAAISTQIPETINLPQNDAAFYLNQTKTLPAACTITIKGLVTSGEYELYGQNENAVFIKLETITVKKKSFSFYTESGGCFYLCKAGTKNSSSPNMETQVVNTQSGDTQSEATQTQSESVQTKEIQAVSKKTQMSSITEEALKEIQGQNQNLVFVHEPDSENSFYYTMIWNGTDVVQPMDVDTSISSCEYEKELHEIAERLFAFTIHQEKLPGTTYLTIETDLADGEYLLCRYDPEKKQVEYINKITVEDGMAKMLLETGGNYFLSTKVLLEDTKEVKETIVNEQLEHPINMLTIKEVAKEAGMQTVAAMAAILIMAVLGGLLAIRRIRENK